MAIQGIHIDLLHEYKLDSQSHHKEHDLIAKNASSNLIKLTRYKGTDACAYPYSTSITYNKWGRVTWVFPVDIFFLVSPVLCFMHSFYFVIYPLFYHAPWEFGII